MRDGRAIIHEVAVIGVRHRFPRRFQLDKKQRQAVGKTDDVRPLRIKIAREPDLASEQEIIGLRSFPIDDPDGLILPLPSDFRQAERSPLSGDSAPVKIALLVAIL
jgi:hypothetical protein